MRLRRLVLIIISLSGLAMIVIFPDICLSSALNALNMWFSLVVPALLPFFIGAGILMETGVVRLVGAVFEPLTRFFFSLPGESAYVFIASAISGYPMGVRLSADLYREKKLDLEAAQRTVCFTSVGGPLFILGTVSCGMLAFPAAGVYIAAGHYIGAMAAGMLTGFFFKRVPYEKKGYLPGILSSVRAFRADGGAGRKSIGDVLEQAVTNGVATMLLIGGMMVLFNVLTGIFERIGIFALLSDACSGLGIPKPLSKPVLAGILEIANGCRIAAASTLGMGVKIPVLAFIISFGGFSMHAQTYAIAARAGLKLKLYMTAKIIQALVSFFASFLLLQAFPLTAPAFAETGTQYSPDAFAYTGSAFAAAAFALLLVLTLRRRKKPFPRPPAALPRQ